MTVMIQYFIYVYKLLFVVVYTYIFITIISLFFLCYTDIDDITIIVNMSKIQSWAGVMCCDSATLKNGGFFLFTQFYAFNLAPSKFLKE